MAQCIVQNTLQIPQKKSWQTIQMEQNKPDRPAFFIIGHNLIESIYYWG